MIIINKKPILRMITILFFIYVSLAHICFAVEIGNENVQIDSYGEDAEVPYVITDPQGHRIGYDPKTDIQFEEFPASYGSALGIRDEISEKFHDQAMFNLIPGTYTIEVIGVGLTQFDLGIGISRRILSEGITGFNFNGIIDKGLTSKFQFAYNSDPLKPAGTATRIATSSSLKQDITLSRKVGWIDNDGIMNSLLKKVEAAEASIAKGNKNAAKNQLNAFINEVKAQTEKHINKEASKMLLEDAEYLIKNL